MINLANQQHYNRRFCYGKLKRGRGIIAERRVACGERRVAHLERRVARHGRGRRVGGRQSCAKLIDQANYSPINLAIICQFYFRFRVDLPILKSKV